MLMGGHYHGHRHALCRGIGRQHDHRGLHGQVSGTGRAGAGLRLRCSPDTVTSDPDAGCIPMQSIPEGQGIASTPTVGSIERITANPTYSKSVKDRTLSYRIILLPVVKATQNYLKKVGSAPGLQEIKFSSSHTEVTGDAYAALHRICPMGNIQLLAGPCRQFSPAISTVKAKARSLPTEIPAEAHTFPSFPILSSTLWLHSSS